MTKMAAKWLKSIPNLWPKRLKNHTLWGHTYLYGPYKGVPPGVLVKGRVEEKRLAWYEVKGTRRNRVMSVASASWRTICPQHEQKGGRPDLSGEIVSSIAQMPLLGFTSWIRVITKILQRSIFFLFFFLFVCLFVCFFFWGEASGKKSGTRRWSQRLQP